MPESLPFPLGLRLSPEVKAHNIEMMRRPEPPPRTVGPWHSSSVHEDDCRCARCRHLLVNGFSRLTRPV